MTYTITSPTRVADMSALDDLMSEYYGVVLAKLTAAGGPAHLTPDDLERRAARSSENPLAALPQARLEPSSSDAAECVHGRKEDNATCAV